MKNQKVLTPLLAAVAAFGLMAPARADLASNLKHTPAKLDSFVNFSTAYQDWSYFLARKPFSQLFAQLRSQIAPELEAQLGLSFEKDLAPLLGTNLNIAIYDEELSKAGERLPFLLICDIRDTAAFPKLLARLKQLPAKDKSKLLLELKYQGVPMYGFATVKNKEGVPYMALSGRTMLVGSKSLVMKAIDSGQGKQPGALSDPAFKTAHDSLHSQKLWAWSTPQVLPNYLALGAKASPKSRGDLESARASLEETLGMYDSLGFGMDLSRTGLVFKTVARVKEQGLAADKRALLQDFRQIWNDSANPMGKIMMGSPARPLFFAGVNGLQLMDRSLSLFGMPGAEQKQMMAELDMAFGQLTHLNFRQDVLKYSDGRGGVSVFYPEDTKVFDRPPQVVCFLGIKDNAGFQQILSSKLQLNLGAMGKKGAPAEVVTFPKTPNATYQGHPLYVALESPVVKNLRDGLFMQPSYSHVGNVWLFASSPDALKSGIDHLSGRRANLTGNAYFNQLKNRFGLQTNGGLMFIELSSAMKLVEFLGGEDKELKALKPTLAAFRSIMAGGSYRGNVVEGTMVLDIDMDKVNFELLGKFFGSHGNAVSDPSRNRPPRGTQPVRPAPVPTAKPTARPRTPGAIGL